VISTRPLFALLLLTACDGGPSRSEALETYASIARANYDDSLTTAAEMRAAIAAFVATPSDATLEDARDAWLAAREPYGQTEVFRFYGGPIEQGDPEYEGALNAWPIDEAVVDYVRDPSSGDLIVGGLVNATTPIDEETLRTENGRAGDAAITTGYHPIEFLLWGQDSREQDGAGQRPFTDYVDGEGENADRRGSYITLASDLLIEDLTAVRDAWNEGSEYRTQFVAEDGIESLRDAMYAIAFLSLGELGGERILVALTTGDQEDEHSCFSDNTHRDIVANATGMRNVYLGRYVRVDGTIVEGPSISDLVAAQDAALDEQLRTALDEAVAAAEAFAPPFDLAIADPAGRAALMALITELEEVSNLTVEAGALFGFDIALTEE
jgi:putative iron-regulated protein